MDTSERSEFIRGPKWRTRTSGRSRAIATVVTFTIIVAAGGVVVLAGRAVLDRLGAPGWAAWLPWTVPTMFAAIWVTTRPAPALLSDDDDDSWTGFVIRSMMIGRDTARPPAVRIGAAIVFGAPVAWALVTLGVLSILGIF